MIIKYLSGEVAYETHIITVSKALAEAVKNCINLKSICLRKKKIINISYRNVDFSRSSFWGGYLKNVRFVNCTMVEVDFRVSKLKNIIFESCDLSHTDFRGVCLKEVEFIQSNLSYCKFNNPNIFCNKNFMSQKLFRAKYICKDGNEILIKS